MTSDQITRDIATYTKEAETMQERADANRANGFSQSADEYQRFADNARAMAEELQQQLEQATTEAELADYDHVVVYTDTDGCICIDSFGDKTDAVKRHATLERRKEAHNIERLTIIHNDREPLNDVAERHQWRDYQDPTNKVYCDHCQEWMTPDDEICPDCEQYLGPSADEWDELTTTKVWIAN